MVGRWNKLNKAGILTMSFMTKLLIKTNVFVYRLTGGKVGGKMGQNSLLLLNTLGRKSGKPYTIPLNYFRDGENYIIVASNWGGDHHPGWFRNLMSQPLANIQVLDQVIPVQPHEAAGEEYERLWKFVTSRNDFYTGYQEKTTRKIPIVILTRLE
jgi:F420H(2)-dependent quinone reductase